MRTAFISLISFLIFLGCRFQAEEKQYEKLKGTSDCLPGADTFNIITVFKNDTLAKPSRQFFSLIDLIQQKEMFKPKLYKNRNLLVEKQTEKIYPVAYDTCKMSRWITKNFIMKNMNVSMISFIGMKKDKFIGYPPGLYFEEWQFTNNLDRDSAMKIVSNAYNYPDNIVAYEKRYSQFVLGDKRIYLLEARAKFSESYAIKCKKLIEQHIKSNLGH